MGRPRTIIDDKPGPRLSRRSDRVRKRELDSTNPVIKIGLMEEYDRIDFTLNGRFDVVDLEGEPIETNIESHHKWHIVPDVTIEAKAVFSILITAFARRDAADKLRKRLSAENHMARVAEVGEEILIERKSVSNNIKYRVLVGRWPTEREAKANIDILKEEFAPRVIRQIVKPTRGTVELFNDEFETNRLVERGVRFMPLDDDSNVMLHAVREGTGFHWEREVDRTYQGIIEIRLDHRALLLAFTELPLEKYLMGVVPSEMPASYPMEALKAQTVAARSEVLAKIGIKHLNDPFDICGTVHCQVYSGITNIHERTNEAIEATRGQVILLNNKVAEAVFSSCCGGHTENKVNVWNPPDSPHLQGYWDIADDSKLDKDEFDLTTEFDTERWINSKPDVWCNAAAHGDIPVILKKAERVFRWTVTFPHRELEGIIRRKSGEDIGTLINIIPLKRGLSGRLMEIEIQGTKRNIKVQRELNIRRVLSKSYLYSACFSIDVEYGETGAPLNFIFKGAGWGHGVGMCQVGAGVQAAKDRTFKTILHSYYPGTDIKKIYGGQ